MTVRMCAAGHPNTLGGSFCTTCGLALGAPSLMPPSSSPGFGGPTGFPTSTSSPTAGRDGLGVASLIAGISGLILLVPGAGERRALLILPLLLALLAMTLGVLSLERMAVEQSTRRNVTWSGLATGILAFLIYLAVVFS